MDLAYLKYLIEVERFGSINKASKALNIRQQHLSKIIMKIEEEMGTTIFNRSNTGVTLTHDGEAIIKLITPFIKDFEHLINEINERESEQKNACTEELIIYKFPSVTADYYVSFSDFITEKHNHILVRINELPTEIIIEKVKDNPLHVGIGILIGEEAINLTDLVFLPMIKRYAVVYSDENSNFARTHQTTTLNALKTEKIVEYRPFNYKDSLIEKLYQGKDTPEIKYSMTNLRAFYDCLKDNQCVSIGTSGVKHSHQNGVHVTPLRDPITITQGLIINKKSEDEVLVQAFIKAFKEFYKPYLISH